MEDYKLPEASIAFFPIHLFPLPQLDKKPVGCGSFPLYFLNRMFIHKIMGGTSVDNENLSFVMIGFEKQIAKEEDINYYQDLIISSSVGDKLGAVWVIAPESAAQKLNKRMRNNGVKTYFHTSNETGKKFFVYVDQLENNTVEISVIELELNKFIHMS